MVLESLFWTAPEHLRKWVVQHQKAGSIQGDIYSFGIIAKELVTRDSPFGCEAYIPADGNYFKLNISSDIGCKIHVTQFDSNFHIYIITY